jgi:hypothetical protein
MVWEAFSCLCVQVSRDLLSSHIYGCLSFCRECLTSLGTCSRRSSFSTFSLVMLSSRRVIFSRISSTSPRTADIKWLFTMSKAASMRKSMAPPLPLIVSTGILQEQSERGIRRSLSLFPGNKTPPTHTLVICVLLYSR